MGWGIGKGTSSGGGSGSNDGGKGKHSGKKDFSPNKPSSDTAKAPEGGKHKGKGDTNK